VSLALIADALAEQLESELGGTANPVIANLQVENRRHPNPTPPCIDVWAGSPWTEVIGYGNTRQYWFNVRARVGSVDNEAGQDLLLAMMDNQTAESVEAAIRSTRTYAGAQLGDIEALEYGPMSDIDGQGETFHGCTWRVALIP
jgi:hypothetical protein